MNKWSRKHNAAYVYDLRNDLNNKKIINNTRENVHSELEIVELIFNFKSIFNIFVLIHFFSNY